MASIEELRDERLKKREELLNSGVSPYPNFAKQDFTIEDTLSKFSILKKRKKPISIVGRIRSIREHGGSIFFDIDDGTGAFQCYLKKSEVGESPFKRFMNLIDIGDFVECRGTPFITKKNEKTLSLISWKLLVKSLRPLPDKWHGLQDVEERYRKRYLDLIMSGEVKNKFIARSKIIKEIRTSLDKQGFMEVETPMLQVLAGGANAKPFITHHNALNTDLYLRIAPELYLKELLVGGINRVYELGRNFRNEGIDSTHNPEFTSVEVYAAYSTPVIERERIEKLIKSTVKVVTGGKIIVIDNSNIDLSKKFKIVSFSDLIKKHALIPESDLLNIDVISLKAKQFGVEIKSGDGLEKILDNIYKKICRPKIIEPTFIIDYPKAFSPFAKGLEGKSEIIDKFQLIIGGAEIVNGFLELNDPVIQEERFVEQERKRESGDEEATLKDQSYIEALEYGLPPATGWAIGIDRLVMLINDTKNIRENILFPTLRPK